jgi:hypothetical protein
MYLVTRHRVWIDNWIYWTLINRSAIDNSHTLQITIARTKTSQLVFTSSCLVTDPNNVLIKYMPAGNCLTPNSCLQTYSHSRLNKFSESKLLYDWRFIANQFILASSPLRPTIRDLFFQLNSCGNSPYATSSLTGRWTKYKKPSNSECCTLSSEPFWIFYRTTRRYIPEINTLHRGSNLLT